MAYQNDHPSLRLSMLIIAAGTISTSLAQPDLLDLPIRHLLKDELHVSESQMAMLFSIGALAWYVKPLAGLLVDRVALFGTHQRYYLIISALMAATLWLVLGLVSHSYYPLLITVAATQSMLVIGSTVLGGFLVERSKSLQAEGRLVSCSIFVEHVCVLIAGPLAGYLAGLPFGMAAIIGAMIAIVIAPIAVFFVSEPIQDKSKIVGPKHSDDLRLISNARAIWPFALFLLVSSVPQSFGTPLYFFQKNALALSDVQIGYLTAIGGVGGLLATILYPFLCRRLPMQGLLILGIFGSCIGALAYLFYRSLPTALLVEFAGGLAFGMGTLALMEGAVISTSVSSTSFWFAMLMGLSNAGAAIGDNLSAFLVEYLSMTLFDVAQLFAAMSAGCFLFIPFLPRGLLNHREGKT